MSSAQAERQEGERRRGGKHQQLKISVEEQLGESMIPRNERGWQKKKKLVLFLHFGPKSMLSLHLQ